MILSWKQALSKVKISAPDEVSWGASDFLLPEMIRFPEPSSIVLPVFIIPGGAF
jgi:hypothetical protein